MNHAYNPNSQKAEARRPLQVWGQPWLDTDFEARLSTKPIHKTGDRGWDCMKSRNRVYA